MPGESDTAWEVPHIAVQMTGEMVQAQIDTDDAAGDHSQTREPSQGQDSHSSRDVESVQDDCDAVAEHSVHAQSQEVEQYQEEIRNHKYLQPKIPAIKRETGIDGWYLSLVILGYSCRRTSEAWSVEEKWLQLSDNVYLYM